MEEQVTWDYLKTVIKNGACPYIYIREKNSAIKYTEHMNYIKQHYKTTSDYIKVTHLKYKAETDSDGLIISVKTNESLDCNFTINDFPYYMEDCILHCVFWSTIPIDHNELLKEITDENILWFENDLSRKSIKDLWHVQVLLKIY